MNLNDFTTQEKLNKILKLDKKQKTNKTIAIVLSSMAITGLIFSGTTSNKSSKEIDKINYMIGGVVYGGVSIPFWVSSKRRKRQIDKNVR
ncbi:hypothetical protein Q4553_00865 [Tenacibaculum soleae]|uniref:hypothetical protein n=1 Tax=Tenacibaculum soleae TaxID=447689 RepID=UPI0026E3AEE1|nr:hypothetical protein [Tenacibaculum soleae]MDO6743114.1 hypothetical protein [Tenacibaculum soleae]